MQLTLGGHLPPLLVAGDQLRELSELRGIALGVAADVTYEKEEIFLSPGESILFVTDGVTEAENERSELFGQRRLSDHITSADGPPYGKGLLDTVNAWRGTTAEANDDLTMMEIWRDLI
jgi:serine phosphatase RsbU (regulator of sigma subunit)